MVPWHFADDEAVQYLGRRDVGQMHGNVTITEASQAGCVDIASTNRANNAGIENGRHRADLAPFGGSARVRLECNQTCGIANRLSTGRVRITYQVSAAPAER